MTPSKNPPPSSVLETIRHYLLLGDDLQRTRRHVLRHHGRAEWLYLATSPHEPHGRERSGVARRLRDMRRLSLHNGYAPREVVRLARAINRA